MTAFTECTSSESVARTIHSVKRWLLLSLVVDADVGISGDYLVPRERKDRHEVDAVARSSRGPDGINGLGTRSSE